MEQINSVPSTERTALLWLEIAYVLANNSPEWKIVFSDPVLFWIDKCFTLDRKKLQNFCRIDQEY